MYHYINSDDTFRVMNVPAEALPFAFTADQVETVVLAENMMRKINDFYPLNAAVMATNALPAATFTLEETADVAFYQADIVSYITKMLSAFITGQSDIDTEYEAFINQLKKMGVDEYLKLYQGLYDRFQAALK